MHTNYTNKLVSLVMVINFIDIDYTLLTLGGRQPL